MKNLNLKLASIFALVLLFSCSDDEGEIITSNQLIGTWQLTQETDSDGENYIYEASCNNTWQFTDDTISARWDDDCNGEVDDSDFVNYTLDGNRIRYQGDSIDGEEVFIKKLNSSKLEIEFIEDMGTEDEYSYILFFDKI